MALANTSDRVYSASLTFLKALRPLFYVEPPSQSSFEDIKDVPNYLDRREYHERVLLRLWIVADPCKDLVARKTTEMDKSFMFQNDTLSWAVPYFLMFIVLEVVVRGVQNKPLPRVNDSINSLTAGLFMMMFKLIVGAFELVMYVMVYERFCVFALPWDSPWTWWIAFLAVDLAYYWFHRMAHEVNLFWASHQTHHSSEDYTLSTALRQSATQRFSSAFFYLPMALAVPPSAYLVHKQFNLLYQFWIHTEVIDKLPPPLEWVLNTASHHRVHHGRNRYCIDKNYAGVLIIWDRMFGTFEAERKEEKVVYGLVHPLGTWDPFWAQVHHYVYLWRGFWEMDGLGNKLSFLFKGPGWSPGKPRLGCIEDIPIIPADDKPYDKPVPYWLNVYCLIHFFLVLVASHVLGAMKNDIPYLLVVVVIIYFTISLTNFGLMFDRRLVSAHIEVFRLFAVLLADFLLSQFDIHTGLPELLVMVNRVITVFSLVLWIAVIIPKK